MMTLLDNPKYKTKYYVVDPDTLCWNWIGCKWGGGYGYVRIGPAGRNKHISAHRYMYALYKDIIPKELDCCHHCDNPSCVNPDHLFVGTVGDNMKDCYRKGRRSQKGINNGNYKTGKHVKRT